MRNPRHQNSQDYPVMLNDTGEPALPGPNCSLVEFQEEVLAPAGPGVLGHRRLRIISINQRGARPEGPAHRQRPAVEAAPERALPAPSAGYRKILDDPGIRLTLPYGKVKAEIAPALKNHQRLRDWDPVECYVQIFEAEATLDVARIAAAELGNPAVENQFHPLTRDKAQMFGVPDLFRQSEYPFELRASSRRLYPGQRVYRLVPAFDPASPAARPVQRPAVQHDATPYPFRHSREEVLYDMKGVLGTLPPDAGLLARWFFIYPCRLLKSVLIHLFSGPHLKKWRAMRQGKTANDQLWVVPPPRGFTYLHGVRRWAAEMLAGAGYEPERTLLEWEIFWRRRGWK